MTFDERLGIPLFLLIAVAAFFALSWPASRYMIVERFDIQNTVAGDVPMVEYQREIVRDFDGSWRITMWRDGVSWCVADDEQRYDASAVLPNPVALSWLAHTNPDCFTGLRPGRYQAHLTIRININSPAAWQRTIRRDDTFTVLPDD